MFNFFYSTTKKELTSIEKAIAEAKRYATSTRGGDIITINIDDEIFEFVVKHTAHLSEGTCPVALREQNTKDLYNRIREHEEIFVQMKAETVLKPTLVEADVPHCRTTITSIKLV